MPPVLQILVPCYSEALDIVAETVWAAHVAQLPAGCTATVWLLDDGRDAAKQAWVEGLASPGIKYVTGRKRAKGDRASCGPFHGIEPGAVAQWHSYLQH